MSAPIAQKACEAMLITTLAELRDLPGPYTIRINPGGVELGMRTVEDFNAWTASMAVVTSKGTPFGHSMHWVASGLLLDWPVTVYALVPVDERVAS